MVGGSAPGLALPPLLWRRKWVMMKKVLEYALISIAAVCAVIAYLKCLSIIVGGN
jgi:hypothetical protein